MNSSHFLYTLVLIGSCLLKIQHTLLKTDLFNPNANLKAGHKILSIILLCVLAALMYYIEPHSNCASIVALIKYIISFEPMLQEELPNYLSIFMYCEDLALRYSI